MKTLGKYEKLDVLGNGVSGIVYLAKDTLLNRQVALKEVDVQAGDVATYENVRSVRPSGGLPPVEIDRVVGRTFARSVELGTPVAWELFS